MLMRARIYTFTEIFCFGVGHCEISETKSFSSHKKAMEHFRMKKDKRGKKVKEYYNDNGVRKYIAESGGVTYVGKMYSEVVE